MISLPTRIVLMAALLLGWTCAQAALDAEQRAFVDEMVREHGFDRIELTGLLEDAQFQAGIIALITRPAESKPWYEYRAIMVTPERVEQGVEFRQRNADTEGRGHGQQDGSPAGPVRSPHHDALRRCGCPARTG